MDNSQVVFEYDSNRTQEYWQVKVNGISYSVFRPLNSSECWSIIATRGKVVTSMNAKTDVGDQIMVDPLWRENQLELSDMDWLRLLKDFIKSGQDPFKTFEMQQK